MMLRIRCTALAISSLLVCAHPSAAQRPPQTSMTLRGVVLGAETSEPLGFSIVTLIPNVGRQFTDQRGVFRFSEVPAGIYLLSVRQIGYTPLDTQLVINENVPPILTLILRHLAVELPAITVTGRATCTQPGAPNPAITPALASVFGQLVENARRLELLADSHPFRFRLERRFREVNRRGDSLGALVDTLELDHNEVRRRYRPGLIVAPGAGPWQGLLVVTLASLHELGDSAFHQNHCFRLAGLDTIEGETLVRIDFEPVDGLRAPDIAGSAYLDSVTYGLRYTETLLTRPQRSRIPNISTLVARTRFTDIAPGIALQEYVLAETKFRGGPISTRVETQRLLAVHFKRPMQLAP